MSNTKIISVLNHKGGIGKTSSVANLGESFSDMGKKTLIVDLDPQANLTTLFSSRMEETIGERNILHAFRDREQLPQYRVRENLYLCPSVLEFAGLDMELASAMGREYILRDLLEELGDSYDIILLDTPPSLGQVIYNSLIASTEVYIPLIPETLPYMGLSTIERLCNTISKSLRVRVEITGVFFTRVEKGSLQGIVIDEVKKKYGERVFSTMIRKSIAVAQAPLANMGLFEYAPSCNAAKDYRDLAGEIIQRLF